MQRGIGPRVQRVDHRAEDVELGVDGRVKEELREELACNPTSSPGHVGLPPPFDTLESHLQHVTLLLEQLGHDLHDDCNAVIDFMNDLQHNKWQM